MSPDQELRSLKRGLKVLDLMNQVEAIGITALARELDLPRTTAERIVSTLATEGYVQRLPHDKRYRLSSRIFTLSRGYSNDCRVIDVATPLIMATTRRIGWPIVVRTVREDVAVTRVTSDAITSLSLSRRRVGASVPLLDTGAGLIAYAFADERERATLLSTLRGSAHAINRERATDATSLANTGAGVRDRGYALQAQPLDSAEHGLSVPILLEGRVCATLELIYIRKALAASSLLQDYLPVLQSLAEEIAERVANDVDIASCVADDGELPETLARMMDRLRQRQLAFAT